MTDLSVKDGVIRSDGDVQSAFLPAATVQSHAANLAFLANGDLGLVWFGGTQEGVADISIYFSRLTPGSDTWTEPVMVSADPTRSEQNPILFPSPSGDLWLLYTAQITGNQDTSEVRARVSTDNGVSWGPVRTVLPATSTGGVFVRQPIVVLENGRWLLPVFNCVSVPGERWKGDVDTSSVFFSDDEGGSWSEVSVPDSLGAVHMNIIRLADGSLAAAYRSRWADFIYQSRSTDGGVTWSAPEPSVLPNNNSSIQWTALDDGRVALVYNHSSVLDATERRVSLYDEIDDDGLSEETSGEVQYADVSDSDTDGSVRTAYWGAPRAPLALSISSDGGQTWPQRKDLDIGDGYCMTNNSKDGLNREYSYPSVVQGPDGDLHVAYTYFRQAIKYVRVSPTAVS